MESEEDAKDTALDLRLKKRSFRGQPVKARIKTEPVVRSYFPVPAPVVPQVPFGMVPFPPVPFPYLPVPPTIDSQLPDISTLLISASTLTAASSSESSVDPDLSSEVLEKSSENENETSPHSVKNVGGRPREIPKKVRHPMMFFLFLLVFLFVRFQGCLLIHEGKALKQCENLLLLPLILPKRRNSNLL
jgi:hypothetical protein